MGLLYDIWRACRLLSGSAPVIAVVIDHGDRVYLNPVVAQDETACIAISPACCNPTSSGTKAFKNRAKVKSLYYLGLLWLITGNDLRWADTARQFRLT